MADANKEYLNLFLESGFDQRKSEDTVKNAHLKETLATILKEAKAHEGINVKDFSNFLYLTATTFPNDVLANKELRNLIIKYIVEKKANKVTFPAVTNFFKKLGQTPFDLAKFEKECGIGIVITREDVKKAVAEAIESKKSELKEQRYHFPIPALMGSVRDALKWADPKDVKDEFDAQILAFLGPKTEEDNKKEPKKKEAKKEPAKAETANNSAKEEPVVKDLIQFPDPRENTINPPAILDAHLKTTGGVVITRFPPEPNGYLHLGHTKSMNLNFSYAARFGGFTYLRFDDTNPEAEKLEYIKSIIEDVHWMGHKPKHITYSSDYFPQLYDLAIKLIKSGKAYVDHQTGDEIASFREKKMNSPWRDRPIEENLRLFDDMRRGKFKEGEATLRMKMDMQNDNPCMRDLIAYRIKYTPHPHVGDKWCIYPSYDYTHCIIDSLENITHSLCTLEFEVRRQSYYWLLDALEIYKPVVFEYSRLNITNTVLSKRRLIKLVKDGFLRGWDDPRMPTIRGYRRKGFTPESINNFCDRVGVTRNENVININLLEQCCREDLDVKANRAMAILEPLRVTITNWEGAVKDISVPNHPKDASRGSHTVPLSGVVYIEKSDFRKEDVKGYKRLAPKKAVGLMHASAVITCTDFVTDANGNVTELKATIDFSLKTKPAGFIHWVAEPAPGKEPLTAEARLYELLFKSEEPAAIDDWVADLNPNSLVIVPKIYVDPSVKGAKTGTQFQFERVGYFAVDPDTTSEKMVWNRVVSLKESKDKDF